MLKEKLLAANERIGHLESLYKFQAEEVYNSARALADYAAESVVKLRDSDTLLERATVSCAIAERNIELLWTRYEFIVNSNLFGVIVLDGDSGAVVSVNEYVLHLTGNSRHDVVGKKIWNVDAFKHINVREKIFIELQKNGFASFESVNLECRNKSMTLVSLSCSKYYEQSKRMMQVLVSDVTDRDLAMEELLKAKNAITSVLDSLPSSIISIDKNFQIINWNIAASKRFKMTSPHHLTLLLEALPDFKQHVDSITLALDQGITVAQDCNMIDLDGNTTPINFAAIPLAFEGVVYGVLIRLNDLTEQVRIERLLANTDKMMALGGLAAGMAHELNNPLSGMLMGAQNIMRQLYADLQPNKDAAAGCNVGIEAVRCYTDARNIRAELNAIMDAGKRASQIIASMLNFTRESSSHFQDASLLVLMEKAISIASIDYDLKKKYDFRQIEITREFEPHFPNILCAPSEIQQVLLNLLRNSAQALASPPPTEMPRIILRLYVEQASAVIEVEDNGPGMDEKVRNKIFEPFYSTKSPGEGTGLGLSVSYFIITRAHGGSIKVESQPGHGARFVIHLPLRREAVQITPP
jgi:PAS domain S-box-containing protein